MAQNGLSAQYWGYCVSHVYMVNNMLPHATISNETPYWRWYEQNPNGRYLHIFGCDVRVNTPIENRQKYIKPPAHIGVYIGFEYDSSVHKIHYPSKSGGVGKTGEAGDGTYV